MELLGRFIMFSRRMIIIFVMICLITSSLYFILFNKRENRTVVTVARIVDGDTFKLANGKSVRLLGIDAPEKRQYHHEKSKNKLKELIEGKQVVLEKDVSNKDGIDRLLRYVFVDDIFINLEMVRQGYASAYIVSPDVKYEREILQAEVEARSSKLGIWKVSDFLDCITIADFNFDAKGRDEENLNDEYFVLKNICSSSINMTGWEIKDRTSNIFTFPNFSLCFQSTVTIHSGSGKNTLTELYWNSDKPVWNNGGDTLYLRDSQGNLVLIESYSK